MTRRILVLFATHRHALNAIDDERKHGRVNSATMIAHRSDGVEAWYRSRDREEQARGVEFDELIWVGQGGKG